MMLRSICFLALFPLCCWAYKPYSPSVADPVLEPWRWRHEEALRGVGAICMDEAPDGTLWFGGTGCVASYDGQRVERIPFDNQLLAMINHQKSNPWAKALLVLEDNSLLVLVGESLVRWRDGDWQVVIQDVGYSEFSACLKRADDGVFWLLVHDYLWRVTADLSGATLVMQVAEEGQELGTFCIDTQGDLWVVRRQSDPAERLIYIPLVNGSAKPESAWREIPIPYENDMTGVSLLAGDDGLIWYADNSRQSGLSSYDPTLNRWVQMPHERVSPGIHSLIKGRDGTIWGGTEGGVLHVPLEGAPRDYRRGTLELPLVPISLFETRNNRLWMIGRIGHVYSVDLGTSEWMTLGGLNFQCETPNGREWFIQSERAVVSHDPNSGEWLRYGPEDMLIDQIYSLTASSHGLVWAAGRHEKKAAIAVFDDKKWSRFPHPDFALWIEPHAAFEAADGSMWFGAGGRKLSADINGGGVLQYGVDETGKPFFMKRYAPTLLPYYATAFEQTPDGTMWIGSTVVQQLDALSSKVTRVQGMGGENTVSMTLDHENSLWVAKEHFGVCRWKNDSWEVFATEDGLASLLLSDLLVLSDGSLLASSDRGISRFDGARWTTAAYSERFGMRKRWSSMRESSDGSIWLNFCDDEPRSPLTLQGWNKRYCTVRHRPEETPPDTRVAEYLERVAQPGNHRITWTADDPRGKTPREDLQYAWRLNGGGWSMFSHATSRTFLDLEHGRHVLEVRARDRAFNIDPTPARVEFVVVAPLWLQPWFISMVLFMVGGTAAFIFTLAYFHEKRMKDRQKHLVEMDQMKTSFFTNISHELNTPLMLIAGPLERVLQSETDEKKKKMLSMAARSAERVATLVSQMLDFRKLEEGKIQMDLVEGDAARRVRDVVEMLRPLAQGRNVECNLRADDPCRGFFDVDKLMKIARNLIDNAIKYTAPGGAVNVSLKIGVEKDERILCLKVEDDGPGIEPEHLRRVFERFYRIPEKSIVDGSGIGLNLTKELVILWGGEVYAESPIHEDENNKGTRFTIKLPFTE